MHKVVSNLKEKHIKNLKKATKKIKKIEHLGEPINWMSQAIKRRLDRDKNYKGNTIKSVIGIDNAL